LIKTTVPIGATTGNVVVTNKVTAMASKGKVFTIGNAGDDVCKPMTLEMCIYCKAPPSGTVCIQDESCDPDLICPYDDY
jgi:hypothetical protein